MIFYNNKMDFFKKVQSSVTEKYNKLVEGVEEVDPDVWQSTKTYKSGDEVKINSKSKWYKCQGAPYGDFCHLNPTTAGGRMAWKLRDQSEL